MPLWAVVDVESIVRFSHVVVDRRSFAAVAVEQRATLRRAVIVGEAVAGDIDVCRCSGLGACRERVELGDVVNRHALRAMPLTSAEKLSSFLKQVVDVERSPPLAAVELEPRPEAHRERFANFFGHLRERLYLTRVMVPEPVFVVQQKQNPSADRGAEEEADDKRRDRSLYTFHIMNFIG